jgi:two-component system, chemotaxis family, sensor kinase CheA
MDDLLREFLTETSEHLDVVDIELVRFEQDPNNEQILRNIFRLVHTIKGTCGFLSLPRLETLAHAAETLMGRFRDGLPVTSDAVSLILATIDRIKDILAELERRKAEPEGSDEDLIGEMEVLSSHAGADPSGVTVGQLTYQVLERPLMPGEDTLDDLERVFRETPGPSESGSARPAATAPARESTEPISKPAVRGTRARSAEAPAAAKLARIQTIRVTVDTLEHLMTMVSELVLTRNQLLDIARRQDDGAFKVPLQRLSHVTAELQEGVMKTRMQPIGSAWQQLPRLVRDVAGELGKQIDLVMLGSETELDRQVLEIIKDPLTHMIRNSADHGIEPPAERRARGKPERGTIRLVAWHEGGTITIEIGDDGRGIDQAGIRRAAVERGLAGELEVERMTDAQAAKFIFHPGFTTARAVTPISGRGVGMDVVKTNVELIGGTVDVFSDAGRGTTFTIKIPLTLAIIAALIVAAGGQRFAVPQMAVLELVRVRPGSDHVIERINGTPVLRLRDRLLPVVSLVGLLAMGDAGEAQRDNGFIVVLQVGRQRFGMLVDGVFHTEEIVVKPMSRKLRHIPFFSGNTILGDGAVVLIIDPNGVSRMIGASEVEGSLIAEEVAEAEPAEDGVTTTLLIFRAGRAGMKAVPLSLVTRLEEIDTSRIEWVAGKPLLQYRGRLMPLIPASAATRIRAEGIQPIVVFADGERSMGLAVDEIVDIVEEKFDIDLIAERPEVLGSAVVRGVATEIVNVGHFLPLAHEDWLKRGVAPARAASRTVLFVDDSAFFRDMLTPVLRAAGYRVLSAGNAEEALAVLRLGSAVDIMVTDIEMPGLNGFELVEAIRRDAALSALPVIALSSYLSRAAIDSARRLGIVEFVAKFDRSGLLAALSEAIPTYGAAA